MLDCKAVSLVQVDLFVNMVYKLHDHFQEGQLRFDQTIGK